MKGITFTLEAHAVHEGVQRRQAQEPLARALARETARTPVPAVPALPPTLQCQSCAPTAAASTLSTVNALSFSWLASAGAGAGAAMAQAPLVRAMAQMPIAQAIAQVPLVQAVAAKFAPTVAPECTYADQYSVGKPGVEKEGLSRFWELFYGVAIANDIEGRSGTISRLLGPAGHYERMSFWVHFIGALVFLVYSVTRSSLHIHEQRVDGALTSAAGYTIAAVFLTSSLYHCTAPDRNFAYVTRVLDYAAIYIGITVATTADIAVATRGFENVPYQTILDLPAAACLLIFFFAWRRWRLPGALTWSPHEIETRAKDGCLLGRGLFSFGHRDLHHSQARQATSLLLFASYFMSVPAAFRVLGDGVANVIVALQVTAFVTVALGMAIDRFFQWPDGLLVEGSMTCLACPSDQSPGWGTVCNSHSVWHLVALISAGLTCVSREYALGYG